MPRSKRCNDFELDDEDEEDDENNKNLASIFRTAARSFGKSSERLQIVQSNSLGRTAMSKSSSPSKNKSVDAVETGENSEIPRRKTTKKSKNAPNTPLIRDVKESSASIQARNHLSSSMIHDSLGRTTALHKRTEVDGLLREDSIKRDTANRVKRDDSTAGTSWDQCRLRTEIDLGVSEDSELQSSSMIPLSNLKVNDEVLPRVNTVEK